MCKLFTGSYGSLGIIAELTFKLRPRPAREATVLAIPQFRFRREEDACERCSVARAADVNFQVTEWPA